MLEGLAGGVVDEGLAEGDDTLLDTRAGTGQKDFDEERFRRGEQKQWRTP